MMSLSLTPLQLRELTGRAYKTKQVDWLASHGWKFELNCFGQPVVSLDYYKLRMGSAQEADQATTQPNWGALA